MVIYRYNDQHNDSLCKETEIASEILYKKMEQVFQREIRLFMNFELVLIYPINKKLKYSSFQN